MTRIHQLSRLLAAFAWSVFVTGCALVSPTDPDAANAARPAVAPYHATGRDGPPGRPPPVAPLPDTPLTLAQATELALANNPEIAAARHDAAAAREQYRQAFGARLPSLRASGAYMHHLDDQRLLAARYNGETGVFGDDIFGGDLVLTLPLFTGGRLINEARAADLLHEAAQHRLTRTREELVFNVASVFHSLLAQHHVIESVAFSQQALEEHRKRVDDLIAAQKAARVDRLRTEVRLAEVRQRAVREQNAQAIQIRLLANLLGFANQTADLRVTGQIETLDEVALAPTEHYIAQALQERPDCRAARAALEAQARSVDAARAGYSPTVSLQGAYGGRWAAHPTDRPAGSREAEDVGRIGVVVDVPIFEGGRIAARVAEQRARLAAAQERLRRLELQVWLDVETALLNIAAARERIAAARAALAQAEESLRIEREKYDLGKGTILDVLDAQSALLDAQTNYYRALADLHIARASLALATGAQP